MLEFESIRTISIMNFYVAVRLFMCTYILKLIFKRKQLENKR